MNPRIGVLASLKAEGSSFQPVLDLGLRVCQLSGWEPELWSDALAERVKQESTSSGVRMSAFWAGWPGPKVWDFVSGPATLGIVPKEYCEMRVRALQKAAGFASRLGVTAIITHLGFIPENPSDPAFAEVVSAVRRIAVRLQALGMEFWFETGQETPVTMLRLIRSVGTGNLGVNLDPANLILYGKGDPVDSLDVFGSLVRNVHAKDGLYPTDPMKLGIEVRLGEGKVRFPQFIRRLAEVGFRGELIIEREISGDQQTRDIRQAALYLDGLLKEAGG
ncbi:MAG TPA: sugar phosphate isomerase/epimerase family protein [Spirochaetia bacterium]|nr:sugar phosphate isomerase/epimerase family protein [Spirochaetia bacterium]